MSYEVRIAIGDDEMAFAFLYFQSGSQRRRRAAGAIHNQACRDRTAITQANAVCCYRRDGGSKEQRGPIRCCLVNKKLRRAWRVDDAVAGNTKPAGQSASQIRL